jgi:hypothetical protein
MLGFKVYEVPRSRQTSSVVEEVATSEDSKGFRIQIELDSKIGISLKTRFFIYILVLKYF